MFLAVFELMSDSLKAIYDEPHQSILLTQGPNCEIFAVLLSRPILNFFFCFIPIKISPNLYGTMDGSKFHVFPGFQKIPCYA